MYNNVDGYLTPKPFQHSSSNGASAAGRGPEPPGLDALGAKITDAVVALFQAYPKASPFTDAYAYFAEGVKLVGLDPRVIVAWGSDADQASRDLLEIRRLHALADRGLVPGHGDYLSPAEFARRLGCSVSTVRRNARKWGAVCVTHEGCAGGRDQGCDLRFSADAVEARASRKVRR
jgi:AraC-like DNA-binding protein